MKFATICALLALSSTTTAIRRLQDLPDGVTQEMLDSLVEIKMEEPVYYGDDTMPDFDPNVDLPKAEWQPQPDVYDKDEDKFVLMISDDKVVLRMKGAQALIASSAVALAITYYV